MTPGNASTTPSSAFPAADLERALVGGELVLHYQPTVDLTTGDVTGLEALLRWHHPERGLLRASEFLTATMDCETARMIDQWALDMAFHQLARWQEDALVNPGFRFSVNMSACDLDGESLVERVREAVAYTGVDPKGVVIEVTRTSHIDDLPAAKRSATALRDLGVTLALDDVVSHRATSALLHSLPFDALKIDRKYVAAIESDAGVPFVRSLVELGRRARALVVAEGVATPAQAVRLRQLGCQEAQGFLWTSPLTAELTERLLETGVWPTVEEMEHA